MDRYHGIHLPLGAFIIFIITNHSEEQEYTRTHKHVQASHTARKNESCVHDSKNSQVLLDNPEVVWTKNNQQCCSPPKKITHSKCLRPPQVYSRAPTQHDLKLFDPKNFSEPRWNKRAINKLFTSPEDLSEKESWDLLIFLGYQMMQPHTS